MFYVGITVGVITLIGVAPGWRYGSRTWTYTDGRAPEDVDQGGSE